jgi:hypothetical protein
MTVPKFIPVLVLDAIICAMFYKCAYIASKKEYAPPLYYKITSVESHLLKETLNKGSVIYLDTTRMLDEGLSKNYIRFKFDLKPNLEADRGQYPSDIYRKCSREKIISFDIALISPDKDTIFLNNYIQQFDLDKIYKEMPFAEFGLAWKKMDSVSEFITKFNECSPELIGSMFQQHGIGMYASIPTGPDGNYMILVKIGFSDNRTIFDKIIVTKNAKGK